METKDDEKDMQHENWLKKNYRLTRACTTHQVRKDQFVFNNYLQNQLFRFVAFDNISPFKHFIQLGVFTKF